MSSCIVLRVCQTATGVALLTTLAAGSGVQPVAGRQRDAIEGKGSGFVGTVFDGSSGRPVQAAFASAMGTGVWSTTDRNGSFRLETLVAGPHTIRIWRIGYTPTLFTVSLDSGQINILDVPIVLAPIPYQMPEIIVEGPRTRLVMGPLREFYRRMNEGRGVFITLDDIEPRSLDRFDQILVGVPGVRVEYLGNLQAVIVVGRGRRAGCAPQFFVDGLWTDQSTVLQLRPEWIEGIEIYRRPAEIPPEFNARGLCGVIVVWTRR